MLLKDGIVKTRQGKTDFPGFGNGADKTRRPANPRGKRVVKVGGKVQVIDLK